MDNFTKGLLERNELRGKALGISASSSSKSHQSPNEISLDKENRISDARITEVMKKRSLSSPRKSTSVEILRTNGDKTTTKTVSSKSKDDADVAVEINITSSQNIQVEVEVAECEIDEDGKMIRKGETVNSLSNYDSVNHPVQLRDSSRKNLKRLGVLYSDTDQISSPIQRTEENFCEQAAGSSTRQVKKFSKLASLASNINNWDDDYSHHPIKNMQESSASPKKTGAVPKITFAMSPKQQTLGASPKLAAHTAGPSKTGTTSKKLLWDKKVMDSLEAQGFTRRDTTGPKLVYDYSASKASPSKSLASTSKTSASSPASTFAKPLEVAKAPAPKEVNRPLPSKIAAVQKSARLSGMFRKDQKDPAEMSLKDRMAIFEKNKGTAPVPKTPYGITDANPIRSNMPELSKKFNFGFGRTQNNSSPIKEKVVDKVPEKAAANVKTTMSKLLNEKQKTISEKQISDEVRKQRDEEMKCLLNRFKQTESETSEDEQANEKKERKRSSSGEKISETSNEEICQKADDKKRSRVSNPARLYPVLSDIESTTEAESDADNYTTATVSGSEDAHQPMDDENDDFTDDENINMSFGREILNTVRKNDLSKDDYLDSTVTSTEVSDAMGDMDEYLNEALEGDDSRDYDDKGSACSDSFQYERFPKRVSFKDAGDIPIKSKLEISPAKNPNGPMTLVHTVSFYRRQQSASASNTPIKKVIHKESSDDDEGPKPCVSRKAREECENKIQRLLDEVMRQQTIISQTSQALNLCASTVEFSGSTEAVEGERHLLVATNRRIACLNEVQRLKVEGMMMREGCTKEKGTLTIQEIIIPLKQTYISRLANDEINGHHLLCLVKYNEFVLATKTLPTLPGLKSVKFTDLLSLNEVYADFKITLEIYGMTAQREILPHDIKYHIQTPNKKRFKSKLQESNLTRPLIQSPGGPNAVRTPALVQYGYIIFSMREIKQKSWVINETAPGVSPLNGNVYLKIDSKITVDVDHCGFLTMFDDISGFGAWHRRWCRLSSSTLCYWKYPEDEKKKEALGQLDLTNIVSDIAKVAPRTICARLHTILMESKRERRSDDAETLVLVPKGNQTTVRHLLAADTKEEREEWCMHLNKSLSLLKSWGHQH